jgi:polar amino acid transport system substrate-binding protein
MRRTVLPLLLSLPLLWPLSSQAAPLSLKMCVFDHPFPPMTLPDGSGQAQELLRRASKLQPVVVENVVLPRFQCMEKLRSGHVDAMLAAFIEERTEYSAYPMKKSEADPARAVGELNFMVSRRQGAKVDWDGKQFTGLGFQPVGTQPGLLHVSRLRQLGAVIDDSGGSPEQVFSMLAQNRVAAVVTQQGEGEILIARKYRGEIEMLPRPFNATPMYLVVNKGFYQKHRAQIDAFWAVLPQVRESADYQQYLQQYPKLK